MKIIAVEDMPSKGSILPCPTEDLRSLYKMCLEMQLLCISKGGVGLSAVQSGNPFNLFIARQDEKSKFRYFVNCDYVSTIPPHKEYTGYPQDMVLSIEGCLSLTNSDGEIRRFKVHRYRQIRMTGQELLAENKLKLVNLDETYESQQGIVYQHECDHARAVLISHIGEEIYLWS